MGIFDNSSRTTSVRSHTDVGREGHLSSCLHGPCFVHCWNRKGSSPNCSHKVGSMELSNISWYAEAFRVPFTGAKGPSPAHAKQPHTLMPPAPDFTLGTMQSDKYRSPVDNQTQTCPSDCQMEKSDLSLQRTNLHCSRVQWRCALHHYLCTVLELI